MEHTEKYLQAKWVSENPEGYDARDVLDAKRYISAYIEGYNQVLSNITCIHEKTKKHMMTGIRYCANPKCEKLLDIE